jgi:hypothetical protein
MGMFLKFPALLKLMTTVDGVEKFPAGEEWT